MLLLLSCLHSLGLGLDLGNSLDQKELTRAQAAHTRIAELSKTKRWLILNDIRDYFTKNLKFI